MVLRVALGEVLHPMDGISVELFEANPAKFWVRRVAPGREVAETFEVEYPSGRIHAVGSEVEPMDALPSPELDLDGDGIPDRIFTGEGHEAELVRVLSGADDKTLFEYVDESEYYYGERAFSLGDLDEDGYGEFALLHPRRIRSYDITPGLTDSSLGITSWVTVVSGSHLRQD